MKNALELQNVSKSFTGFEMKDMTFSLPEGCILGLVGKNGAGKSTTIRLIMDMIHKDSGTIYVLGKNIEEDFTETKQDIGVVLDEPSFPEYVTADQMNNIMKNIYRNWDEKRYYELIDQFELPKWKKQFKNYSKGMKMKLAIAVALSHHAKLLILDEPTSGLDPFMRDEILDILYEFTREEDQSVLISSHIVSDLERLCDYIAYIDQGSLKLYEVKQAVHWIIAVSFLCMSIQIPINLILHLKNIRNRLVGLPLFLVCYVGGRLIFYAIRKIQRIPESQLFLQNAVVISIVMVLVSYIGSVLMWKYRR